eukprot:CAMPEP_0116121864 /NCGR_PEP_ID=MMETSP0329-20121206/3918_1 /TAXON_ID=697910 /ORGANISM="Pseudo-nitzschia arenysensis, Strain B593" /LENGTH=566 /DNA_ID=CAMNT_0003615693 /DNA_START=1412 /DNA_END=3112 /DNA_ORIENTATION=-
MTSYQEILKELYQRTESSESPESLRKILSKYETIGITAVAVAVENTENDNSSNSSNTSENKSQQQQQQQQDVQDAPQLLPFHPSGLTDLLVTKMMVAVAVATTERDSDNTISSTQAMKVSRALVEYHPGVYLHSLARSVSDLVSSVSHENISIGNDNAPGLLRLWVSLITHSPLAVHELLSESFLALLGKQKVEEHAKEALGYVVDDWRGLLQSKCSSEAVRCAVFLVKWVSRLPFGLTLGKSLLATNLFVEMLGDFDDPLQQLGLLDAMIEEFDCTGGPSSTTCATTQAAIDEWLASPPLMSLILQFLTDPLLSDAALRYIGVLSAVKPAELSIVLDHVQQVISQNEGSIPTRDTERLPLVNALSTVAMSSETGLSSILSKESLRRSWWDTDRIAQPKLKAAILVSIAQALPVVEASFGPTRALELYRLVGEDHHRGRIGDPMTTTTDWLLSKMATSPLIEVKIASMALLAAALRIENACLALIGFSDRKSHSALIDLLLSPKREATLHAQSARYDLLTAFFEALKAHPSLEEKPLFLKKLNEKLSLGPHGQKPLQYGADEMETA